MAREQEAEHALRLRPGGIDTHQEPVVYMRFDCHVCRSEGFEAHSRVLVEVGDRHVLATLNVSRGELVPHGEALLSDAAWRRLGVTDGTPGTFRHAPTVESMSAVRGKIYGETLTANACDAIMRDIANGRYADVELAAFIAACAGERMTVAEMVALTRSMVGVGQQLEWPGEVVVDKHCVGGLPGNRTTPIVVAIVAACGLTIPKTSSRAITSPAGTADTMETMTPVALSLGQMRGVVEREGGCVVWGGAVSLSPVDDVLIRVERALDLDSEGQLVASVLSKKVAAGSSHVVIDIPVGPTAKVRSSEDASRLARQLEAVGHAIGLEVRTVQTDGTQPVGRGIGPALEARDVLTVLRGDASGPDDLRARALLLAGEVLELGGAAARGEGRARAATRLEDGSALRKFMAICDAQGGFREPPEATHHFVHEADASGPLSRIDNRRLSRLAKLAGAPQAPAAGVDLHAHVGDRVEPGQPLLTLHAQTPGEMAYARRYLEDHRSMFEVGEGPS